MGASARSRRQLADLCAHAPQCCSGRFPQAVKRSQSYPPRTHSSREASPACCSVFSFLTSVLRKGLSICLDLGPHACLWGRLLPAVTRSVRTVTSVRPGPPTALQTQTSGSPSCLFCGGGSWVFTFVPIFLLLLAHFHLLVNSFVQVTAFHIHFHSILNLCERGMISPIL